MRTISFRIFAEPFSINSAYYLKSFRGKSATKIRTRECRDWGDRVIAQLQDKTEDMKLFREAFNDKMHALHISLAFYIPEGKFYTKAGHISIASCDITNIEKLLVDILFDERFNGRTLDDGTKVFNIDLNDKFITRMVSEKNPSNKDYYIDIVVERVDKPTIR